MEENIRENLHDLVLRQRFVEYNAMRIIRKRKFGKLDLLKIKKFSYMKDIDPQIKNIPQTGSTYLHITYDK